MENQLKALGATAMNCSTCGKMYSKFEFYEIVGEVGKPGVGFPAYLDLLKCVECWRIKYPQRVR